MWTPGRAPVWSDRQPGNRMLLSLKSLIGADATTAAARQLYAAIVARARDQVFYRDLGVPDTPAGRFDMVALHAFLVMERLGRETDAAKLSQSLFDVMFMDIDHNLREMGVGDLGVGKKVKKLAQQFYGLSAAYREGLAAGDDVLAAALCRNLYCAGAAPGGPLRAMTGYLRELAAGLADQPVSAFAEGKISFAGPPVAS